MSLDDIIIVVTLFGVHSEPKPDECICQVGRYKGLIIGEPGLCVILDYEALQDMGIILWPLS